MHKPHHSLLNPLWHNPDTYLNNQEDCLLHNPTTFFHHPEDGLTSTIYSQQPRWLLLILSTTQMIAAHSPTLSLSLQPRSLLQSQAYYISNQNSCCTIQPVFLTTQKFAAKSSLLYQQPKQLLHNPTSFLNNPEGWCTFTIHTAPSPTQLTAANSHLSLNNKNSWRTIQSTFSIIPKIAAPNETVSAQAQSKLISPFVLMYVEYFYTYLTNGWLSWWKMGG